MIRGPRFELGPRVRAFRSVVRIIVKANHDCVSDCDLRVLNQVANCVCCHTQPASGSASEIVVAVAKRGSKGRMIWTHIATIQLGRAPKGLRPRIIKFDKLSRTIYMVLDYVIRQFHLIFGKAE